MINYLFLNSASVWGGNEKWTHMAATALAKFNNVYLAYKHPIVGERYSLTTTQLPFRFSFDPQTIVPLISFVKKNNIDVLIPTKKRDYVIAGIVAQKCKKINVLRLGIVRKLGQNPYKNLIYNAMSHGIIVNAEKIKEVLLASTGIDEDKIRVIYNGLDTESIDARSAEEFPGNKPFPFMICTIGRVSKRKGLDVAIKMFADFLEITEATDTGLVIIGSGKRIDEFQSLTLKLGISGQVLFTGFLADPYPYLKMSDVYLTYSQNEGISNALLEAMYLEKPVMTSKAGGADEIIIDRQNGLLLEKDIVQSGVEGLIELYTNDKLRSAIGKAAYYTVREKCSIDRMTSEIDQFCTDIVRRAK